MLHPEYDLQAWMRKWPFDRWRDDRHRSWRDALPAFSAPSIAVNEQIRQIIWPDIDREEQIPCDVFAWAWGEPELPFITKIGGVPFMDVIDDWPHDDDGNPMGFVCQINFQDSFDLLGDLPGDLLLFFSKVWTAPEGRVYLAYSDNPASYAFRWIRVGEVLDPIPAPGESGLDLAPLHGVRHRTYDVPSLDYWVRMYAGKFPKQDPIYQDAFPPAIWWAIKIGGVPHWEQGTDLGMTPWRGRFLCQIISDHASATLPDTYLSPPKPSHRPSRNHQLCFGDVGSAYLFLVQDEVYFCSQS